MHIEEYEKQIRETGQFTASGIEMREQLIRVEDFLRSVFAVANRDGQDTNWQPFRMRAHELLMETHDTLGWKFALEGGDTCTAKTFAHSQ